MTVPIVSYGHVVLRQVCRNVDPDDPCLESIMANLTDTMDAADGVGLAGPQINEPINMFLVDTQQIYERMNEEDRLAYLPYMRRLRGAGKLKLFTWIANSSYKPGNSLDIRPELSSMSMIIPRGSCSLIICQP